MTVNLAEEAIAVLVGLAQRGEIDPWDVQVIDVIDRYLSKLALSGDLEPHQEQADLPRSGQAFLWASMLVLLKADSLDIPPEPDPEDIPEDCEDAPERELPARMEKHIRRRPTAPPLRRRRVTLAELITQIQQMARVLETKPPRPRPQTKGYSHKEAVQHITALAHDENLTEMAAQLETFVREVLPQYQQQLAALAAYAPTETIPLEQLVQWWAESQQQLANTHERVGVFWALLLLASQSKVELFQTEFYADLSIKPLII